MWGIRVEAYLKRPRRCTSLLHRARAASSPAAAWGGQEWDRPWTRKKKTTSKRAKLGGCLGSVVLENQLGSIHDTSS